MSKKISELPLAEELKREAVIPIVQNGENYKAKYGDMVSITRAEDEDGKSIPRTAVFDGNKVYTKGGVSLGQNTSAGGKCFILRSGKKETKGCSLVVGFMTDDEFNTLSGLVAGGLYISARLDYNFDGYKVTKIEKVTDGKVADGDVRFTLDSEFRAVEGKNWYAESNFPDRLTADKAACVSVGTNTPENTVKTATLWVIGHPEVGTFGIDELVDTDGNIVSAHSEGYKNVAHNIGAHAEGRNTKAEGKYSHTEGDDTTAGYGSHAEGKLTKALGNTTHAEGHQTECSPQSANAHAEGYGTKVTSIAGHAEGLGSSATADAAHAEGSRTNAKGYGSHSEGYYAAASGAQSHAEGCGTKASGESSHAEGDGTQAKGKYSHAGGYRTTANNDAETAVGKYNKSDADTLYSVGNGTSDTNRKNAFEVKNNGDAYFEGKGYAGGKELADKETVESVRKSAESKNELINSEIKRQSNRLSNLESAVTGKITETVTFADKVEAKGRTLPAAVLPYARLNRIGGITKATSVTAGGVRTWTDTPSDIKYIRTRGYNQGGVIKDVTTNPFHVKLEKKYSDDTEYYDYSYATECTLTEDGKLHILAHEYLLNLQKGDKIRITIKSSTVDGATFVGGSLEKVPVTTNTSGSVYVFENAKDYLYVYPPTQNADYFSINNAAARIYGDNNTYVGDISYRGYSAGKPWTPKNPNETYNWRIAEYYYEATVKESQYSVGIDWTIPLGVFGYDPTENMTAEEKQAFNPQTDYNKYSLPADYYRPYEESITALPDTDKPLHGFSKNYSNWLTFGDDGTVDYTDNYVKYVCDITKYEEEYEGSGRYFFDDATVTVPLGEAGWDGMTATNEIEWSHYRPDYMYLHGGSYPDYKDVAAMQTYLSENVGLFAARTKMNSNGETITTEKVSDGYSPYIPVYGKGIIQLLDSNKKPTDGILDITYQTKIAEA